MRALGLLKLTVPGPLTWLHVVVSTGGIGSPSSMAAPVKVAMPGSVITWSRPVLHDHLLRRANAFDDGTHLHGDGAQSEEIRLFVGFGAIALRRELSDPMSHSDYGLCQASKSRIAGEMMPSTHEAVKGWLTGDTRNRVRG